MVIPERWREVLLRLQANGFPEAIIAGGSLRDLDNGKPVKDVDVFVRIRDEDAGTLPIKDMIRHAMGYAPDKCVIDFTVDQLIEGDPAETYSLHEMSVVAIYEYTGEGVPIQIIVMQTDAVDFTQFVIDDFDIGFCQCWYTGHPIPGTLRDFDWGCTNHYLIDKQEKRLTVVKCENENALERTKLRIRRLLEKYPDFTPVDVAIKEEEYVPF